MNLAAIQADGMRFLAETRLSNEVDEEGRRWLHIPGHKPRIIPALAHAKDPFEIRLRRRSNQAFYEETTTLLISFLLQRFRPGVFYDLGASTGYFAFVAASHIEARPEAHAFEMQPQLVDIITTTAAGLDLPGQVFGHLAGLSDQHTGMQRVWYARTRMFEQEPAEHEYREPWWIRLKFALQGSKSERGKLHHADVLVTSLDRFSADRGLAPGLIKIDVDGYEGKVLRGSERVLREVQPVIVLELHKDSKQRDGILRADCVAMLFDAGYSALFVTDHQDLAKCRLVAAGQGDPLFARQETDMVLFLPPRATDD